MRLHEHPLFCTATILEWKPLLKPDKFKDIIISSMRFLVEDKRALVYAFVIMSNHIHFIWPMRDEHLPNDVQHSFLKYMAQIMIKYND